MWMEVTFVWYKYYLCKTLWSKRAINISPIFLTLGSLSCSLVLFGFGLSLILLWFHIFSRWRCHLVQIYFYHWEEEVYISLAPLICLTWKVLPGVVICSHTPGTLGYANYHATNKDQWIALLCSNMFMWDVYNMFVMAYTYAHITQTRQGCMLYRSTLQSSAFACIPTSQHL